MSYSYHKTIKNWLRFMTKEAEIILEAEEVMGNGLIK